MTWAKTSEMIDEIAAALTVALGEMADIPKNHEARIPTKSGGNFSYKYADLADMLQYVRPILSAHGVAVVQNASSRNDNTVSISTTLLHRSGQYLTFEPLDMPAGRTAQETGSAITYGRRYHLLACLGLATEDDDGQSAAPRQQAQSRQETRRGSETRRTEQQASGQGRGRTTAEETIRTLLEGLEVSTAKNIRGRFVEKWGRLVDLDPQQHTAALAWVKNEIANEDAADAEWVAQAQENER